ncbi:hypothetical protein [Enterococcus sp. AZ163]|uniref:hypothetical protein n=1 Tax=Enterococcus sp. AZ163 TaxID=2774638 RepID=UPI003D2AAFC4
MNKHLIIAFALPSMLFYQSNVPILYSEVLLIHQVTEEQSILEFDLGESGNEVVVFNEPKETSNFEETMESGKSNDPEKTTVEAEGEKPSTKKDEKLNEKFSENVKHEASFFSNIEQKFVDLPSNLSTKNKSDSELARMLGNMSGTIVYGIKINTVNREDFIFF